MTLKASGAPGQHGCGIDLLVALSVLSHPLTLLWIGKRYQLAGRQCRTGSVDASVYDVAHEDRSIADIQFRLEAAIEPPQCVRQYWASAAASTPGERVELIHVATGGQAEPPGESRSTFVYEMGRKRSTAANELPRVVMLGDAYREPRERRYERGIVDERRDQTTHGVTIGGGDDPHSPIEHLQDLLTRIRHHRDMVPDLSVAWMRDESLI